MDDKLVLQPLIAVVDDDPAFLHLMERFLRGEGYRVTTAEDGVTAYLRFQGEKPDLVIMDLRMGNPESGMSLLQAIRGDPGTAHIPLILCSADSRFLREQGESLRKQGCEIIEKPFDLDELLSQIQWSLLRHG